MAERPGLIRLLEEREALQAQALEDFERNLLALSENIARRLGSVLGVDPDEIFPRRGDDGRDVGATDFEARLDALDEAAQLRASVLLASLEEIEDFVEACGLDRTRADMRDTVGRLSALSEQSFQIQGVAGAVGALDTVSAEALLVGHYEMAIEDGLVGIYRTQAAQRIKEALVANIGLVPANRLAQDIAAREERSLGNSRTEARTRLAQADRVAHEVVRQTLDPEGDQFLIGYMGPRSGGNIRPFCSKLVGKAFKSEELEGLDNGQVGNVLTSAGGYNCRHYLIPIRADSIGDLGLVRGTEEDTAAAQGVNKRAKR